MVARLHHTAYELRRRESILFAAGSAVIGLHAVDVRAWVPLVLVAAIALGYRRLPASARAALAGLVAPLAILAGVAHLLHGDRDGLVSSDLTAFLLFPAAALIAAAGIAALLAWSRRRAAVRVLRAILTLVGATALAPPAVNRSRASMVAASSTT